MRHGRIRSRRSRPAISPSMRYRPATQHLMPARTAPPSADVIPDGTPSFDVIPDGPQGRAGIQTGASQEPLDPRFRGDDSKKNVALLCPLERHRGRCAAPGRPALPDGTQF